MSAHLIDSGDQPLPTSKPIWPRSSSRRSHRSRRVPRLPSRWSARARPSTAISPATWRCRWPSRSSATRASLPRRWSARCRPRPFWNEPRSPAPVSSTCICGPTPSAPWSRKCSHPRDAYGNGGYGQGKKVQVEFVSANPTGPLHVGHGRGAAYGASLANVLAAAGFDVAREFYVNDAGRQMDILALSTWLRYLELQGVVVAFPPNAYQGDYVREMGAAIAAAHGKRFVRAAERITDGIAPLERRCGGASGCAHRPRQAVARRRVHVRARLRPDRAARGLPQRPAGVRRELRQLVLGALAVRHGSRRARAREAARSRAPLRAGRRGVVSLQRLRRREGSRGAARERAVHLLRLRHRLSSEQVRARLRAGDRRLGRGPPRLHPARQGRAAGARGSTPIC